MTEANAANKQINPVKSKRSIISHEQQKDAINQYKVHT